MDSYKEICGLSDEKTVLVLKEDCLGVAFGTKYAKDIDYGMKMNPVYFCSAENILRAYLDRLIYN